MIFYFIMRKDYFKQKLVLLPHVPFKAALVARLVISGTLFSVSVTFTFRVVVLTKPVLQVTCFQSLYVLCYK